MNGQIFKLACYGVGTLVSGFLLLYVLWAVWRLRKEAKETKSGFEKQLDAILEEVKSLITIQDNLASVKQAAEKDRSTLQEKLASTKLQAEKDRAEMFAKMASVNDPTKCLIDQSVVTEWKAELAATNKRVDELFTWINSSVNPILANCSNQLQAEYQRQNEETKKAIEEECAKKIERVANDLAKEQQAKEDALNGKAEAEKQIQGFLELVGKLNKEKEDLSVRLENEPNLRTENEEKSKTIADQKADLEQFEWLRKPQANWLGTLGCLDGILKGRNWYSDEFRMALLHALMATSFADPSSQEDTTINGTADEMLMRVDEEFYKRLHENDDDFAVLEQIRQVYFGRFNELFAGRYEIRWPKKGEVFDESFCRLDRDNGFTEVRVAISCAIFENGDLKRRARVETVPRT